LAGLALRGSRTFIRPSSPAGCGNVSPLFERSSPTERSHREVLLLDEPLGSLDPLTRTTMQEWLLLVWQQLGKSILLVTHDVDEAIFLSDLIYLFSRRPAHVRRQFNIDLPRPRARAAQSLIELKTKILDLIHTETLND